VGSGGRKVWEAGLRGCGQERQAPSSGWNSWGHLTLFYRRSITETTAEQRTCSVMPCSMRQANRRAVKTARQERRIV